MIDFQKMRAVIRTVLEKLGDLRDSLFGKTGAALNRGFRFMQRHPILVFFIFFFVVWPMIAPDFNKNPRLIYVIDAETNQGIPNVMVAAVWRGQINFWSFYGSNTRSFELGREIKKSNASGLVDFGALTWTKLVHNIWATFVTRRDKPMKIGYADITPLNGVDPTQFGMPSDARVYVMRRETAASLAESDREHLKPGKDAFYYNLPLLRGLRPLSDSEQSFADSLSSDACSFDEVKEFYFRRVKPLDDFFIEKENEERKRRGSFVNDARLYIYQPSFYLKSCQWLQEK